MNTAMANNHLQENFVLMVGDKEIQINEDGYLLNFDDWSEDAAKAMADIDHIELAEYHWQIFKVIRNYYQTYQVPPSSRVMKKAIGDKIQSWGFTGKTIERAFPLGGCKHACRLAGLPAYEC